MEQKARDLALQATASAHRVGIMYEVPYLIRKRSRQELKLIIGEDKASKLIDQVSGMPRIVSGNVRKD